MPSRARPVIEFVLPGTGEFCSMRRVTWVDMIMATHEALTMGAIGFTLPHLAVRVCTFDGNEKTIKEVLALDVEDFIPIQNHLNAQINQNNVKGA